jgi:hypothetical protein
MNPTHVYIDGFNLYYGALKKTPYKWLNIKRLADYHPSPKQDHKREVLHGASPR